MSDIAEYVELKLEWGDFKLYQRHVHPDNVEELIAHYLRYSPPKPSKQRKG